jgi:hypothetical protein
MERRLLELETSSTRRRSPRPATQNERNRARSSDGDAYREDDAPVGDGAPEVGGLGAHGAVQERLERRRHGGDRGRGRPASRRRGRGEGRASGARRLPEYDPAELLE